MTETPEPASPESNHADQLPRARLRRSQRVGIVFGVVIVAAAGLLAGAGMSPGDVRESISQRLFGDPEPDLADARVVASDATPIAGVTVSLAPTDRGPGECVVIATEWHGSTPDGSTGVTSQRVRCWPDSSVLAWSDPEFRLIRPSDRFGFVMEASIGPVGEPTASVALVGAVFPDVESITAEFGGGAQYSFNVVSEGGWFAAILPDGVADISRLDGTLVNKLASLKLIDSEGRVLATIAPESVGA